MELDLALPVLKEPVDTLREGLRAGGFRAEAAAPHPVQAFQATVCAWRRVGFDWLAFVVGGCVCVVDNWWCVWGEGGGAGVHAGCLSRPNSEAPTGHRHYAPSI